MNRESMERTAMVIGLGELGELDAAFADLGHGNKEHSGYYEFARTPSHQQGDTVLLSAYGKRGSGDLYVFAGMLTGCTHKGRKLTYRDVVRFWCPVVAVYGDAGVHRDDLIGNRGAWGPTEFEYVLPAALVKVPREAEALLRRDPRRRKVPSR